MRPHAADSAASDPLEQQARQLLQRGEHGAAEAIYRELLAAGSRSPGLWINLAALCQRRGALQEAHELLNAALALQPEAPLAWFNRGVVLAQLGDRPAALASYRRCLDLEPGHARAASNLGLLHYGAGELEAAEQAFRTALEHSPHDPEAHNNLAAVLLERGLAGEAIACCLAALAIQPEHGRALSNLGAAYLQQGELPAAIRSCREAIRLQPQAVEPRDTLALALLEQGESEAAIREFQQVLALNPASAQAHYHLGNAWLQLRDPSRAIASYEAALQLRPAYAEADWNLALSVLLSGDYGRGWELFDSPNCLNSLPVRRPHASPACPAWEGETLPTSGPLLLVSEQGLGDTLQFVRYVQLLQSGGLQVTLCTEEKLHGLLQASGIGVPLLSPSEGDAVSEGHWLRLLSLPRRLGVTPEDPLVTGPYLSCSNALFAHWRRILAPERRPIIGLHWQGNPDSELGGLRGRSLALEALAPIAAAGIGSLLSLQRGSGSEQLEGCSFRHRFVGAQGEVDAVWDFLSMAALIAHCDLVITTDSAMAHLAGASGRPTWLLLHHQSEWRWGLDGTHTPWYPSLRLFRQSRPGDWSGVIQRVAAELQGWASPLIKTPTSNERTTSISSQPISPTWCSNASKQVRSEQSAHQTPDPMTRRLHIGGTVAREGWEILNAIPEAWVDHVGKAEDLSRFEDNTFLEVYASHVLEHLGYQSDLPIALREWHRVLAPEGRLMVSVPDLDTLCDLYSQRGSLNPQDRFAIMRMMFGGQVDQYDFHCVGLNQEFLTSFLADAGFSCIRRVNDFGLFADCSTLIFSGRAISLNLEAFKSSAAPGSVAASPTAEPTAPRGGDEGRLHPPAPASAPAGDALQASAGWGGGYYTGLTYGCYSFGELAPNWIDFALLSQRQRPARSGGEGSPFRYLELGSGMGLGLCLLAAAYPEGTFVGIDFHPSHIAHSQWLAAELEIDNVSFHEADFLELAAADARLPFDPGAGFHYAVAHGILSWIGPEIRTALLQLAGGLLRPGGCFYCSYNTFPGWLDRSAFKSLADLEQQRLGPANLPLALHRAGSSLERLLQSASPLAESFPRLFGHVQKLNRTRDIHYLCGEFPEHWQPFYVGQVHALAAAHKLSYAASASLPDNFPSLLPAPLAEQLAAEADSTIRQALQDLAINQSFRRDLFVKGPLPLSRSAQEQQLAQLLLRATAAVGGAADQPLRIDTNLGMMGDESGRLQQLEAMLTQRPANLAELHQALAIPPENLVLLTSLLLHAGRVGLDRGAAGEAAQPNCRAVNDRLLALMQGGHNLGFVAAPAVGHGAQPFSLIDGFVLDGLQQGLDDEILCNCVLMGLQATGVELRGSDGALLTDPDQCLRQIQAHITQFRSTTLPRLVQHGITDLAPEP